MTLLEITVADKLSCSAHVDDIGNKVSTFFTWSYILEIFLGVLKHDYYSLFYATVDRASYFEVISNSIAKLFLSHRKEKAQVFC